MAQPRSRQTGIRGPGPGRLGITPSRHRPTGSAERTLPTRSGNAWQRRSLARLRGIYALARLAKEHPEEYHIQIMELLCAFARYPTEDANFPEQPEDANKFVLREDVQAAMRVVGARGKRHLRLAGKGAYHIDLHGADLRGGELRGLDLSSPSPDMIRSMPVGQAMSNAACEQT